LTALKRYRRLQLVVVLPLLLFFFGAWVTDAVMLKSIINTVRIAVSAGITAAYTPGAMDFVLSDEEIEPGDWLGYGIVLTWLASLMITMFNIVWIAHGQPISWVNTDFVNFMYFLSTGGGVCHLFAPGALKQQIPTRRWIQVGVAVAVAVFLSFFAAWLVDLPIDLRGLGGAPSLPLPRGD
jgi:hypothetical protein